MLREQSKDYEEEWMPRGSSKIRFECTNFLVHHAALSNGRFNSFLKSIIILRAVEIVAIANHFHRFQLNPIPRTAQILSSSCFEHCK
jgi:hypothetical protein